MPRLAQLLASHRGILVLDAASMQVSVGLLAQGQPARWAISAHEAGRAIFAGTQAVLAEAGLALADLDAFLFCTGPGSMLGTRTVAMALRTWQILRARPAYAYQSLALAARAEWKSRPREFTVIADARRENWHVQRIAADGSLPALERRGRGELPAGELLTPAPFRAWSELPAATTACRYDLPALLAAADDADLFQAVAAPDAFQHEAPEYKKWPAQTHSAESVAGPAS